MIKKLDSIRGFAALYVVIHHIIGFTELKEILGPVLRFPFRFGQEAVIVFFLLSGFVIYFSSYGRSSSFKTYFLKRFRRIYPIAIFSFLLSISVVYINGQSVNPKEWIVLLGNFLMLQDTDNKPGLWFDVFLDNHALWSLSYEWIFYLLFFPVILILKQSPGRIYYILLFSIISWLLYVLIPNHLCLVFSYLIIWWAGVEFAEVFIKERNFTFKNTRHILLSLCIMCLASLIPIIQQYFNGDLYISQIKYPIVTFRHFLFAAVVSSAGVLWWRFKLFGFKELFDPFKNLSSISYAMYIIHFPIIWLNLDFIDNVLIENLVRVILILVISYFLEMRFQPLINRMIR